MVIEQGLNETAAFCIEQLLMFSPVMAAASIVSNSKGTVT
jgi:hypothetical protein